MTLPSHVLVVRAEVSEDVVRDGSPIFVRRPIGVDFCVRCTSGAKPTDRFWHFCDVAIGRADIQSWGQSGPNI